VRDTLLLMKESYVALSTESFPDPAQYGREWAEDYDATQTPSEAETMTAVEALSYLANGQPVLEVAAGTGRIAIPLAQKGLAVTATDASEAMLRKLREKDAHNIVDARIDVLPHMSVKKQYGLICLLLNSIWVMQTADEQRNWLRSAAKRLITNGILVVEMGVLNLQTLVEPRDFQAVDGIMTRTSVWNPVTQKLLHRFEFKPGAGVIKETRDVILRAIFPAELLLMAELEGLRMEAVWSDWNKKAFDADSRKMIVLFKRAR